MTNEPNDPNDPKHSRWTYSEYDAEHSVHYITRLRPYRFTRITGQRAEKILTDFLKRYPPEHNHAR